MKNSSPSKQTKLQPFANCLSPKQIADAETEQYLMKIRNKMIRVNKAVALLDKPKPAKLTKANLEELKYQLHESLASVQPRFGSDALDF